MGAFAPPPPLNCRNASATTVHTTVCKIDCDALYTHWRSKNMTEMNHYQAVFCNGKTNITYEI